MPSTSIPAAPLGGHSLLVLVITAGALLVLAMLLGRLAARFGLPAVCGELCAGLILGPSLLGHTVPRFYHWLFPPQAEQVHLLDGVAQFGVLLLVGLTGVDIDLKLVRRRGRVALWVAGFGLVLPLVMGLAAGRLAPSSLLGHGGDRTSFALFAGVAMCVSALPVIAKTLDDMGLLHRDFGQLTVAAGVADDVAGWLLLSVVSALAATGGAHRFPWQAMLWLVVIVLGAVLIARTLAPRVLRRAGRGSTPGPVVATVVAVFLGCAAATQAAGLEASFGAFVGGLVVGTAAEADLRWLAPLRTVVASVLAPLFFATAALRVDLGVLRDPVILGAALVAVAIAAVGKFAGAYLGGMTAKLDRWESLALGAGMNARGVIQLIVASVGLRIGVLNTDSYTIVVLVAVTTSLMAPPILRLAQGRIGGTPAEEERRVRLAAMR
ncbi:sodium/hydrogen exchanger [Catenulispora acidiphila DSM 44928]|uniref:Sodium/hydrogen exchanger n=1 Tax=Catenulispora acidiphila (strain DSM 44928 / JCM 14897 / NBRC 102108 / NRRL B-24433 / ID139908) TaxID=479433 RepID=C7QKD2_CATAD|nr:cation:proton antiporter [Catenulispora acidiphila]ACU75206.1 sodium/hydrogen exchanger [Catenulispora acidiphila DSM 44928]